MQKYSSRRLARRSARTRDDAPNRQLHRHLLAILLAFSDPLRATLSSPVPCAGILLPPSAARESIFSPASLRAKIRPRRAKIPPQSTFSRPCSSDLVLEASKARSVPLLFRHIFPSILFHNPAPVLDSFDSVPAPEILVAAGDEPPEARDGPATTPDWICSEGIRRIRPCFCYSSAYA